VEEKDFDFSAGPEAVKKAALQRVRDAYEIKIKFEDPNALQSLERYTLLGAIDRLWQEHLYAIDALRHSINLRTIGQKDPLIEYKREAYEMFVELMGIPRRKAMDFTIAWTASERMKSSSRNPAPGPWRPCPWATSRR
jgi:preprotein translocase subunit SecA